MPECRIVSSLAEINAENWRSLDTNNNPFLSYDFLYGLEKYHCLKSQYWFPSHLVIEDDRELLAILPLYRKEDSYGEFVFDWIWADAYHRAGHHYYPKLVSAVPFSPVSGNRLLCRKDSNSIEYKNILIENLTALMHKYRFSSAHILFPTEANMSDFHHHNALQRITLQYHWFNQEYRDFQDFTDTLKSKKRKKILHERKAISENDIEIERLSGKSITEEHWQHFYRFYSTTFYKKLGEPRFTLDFFKSLGKALSDQTLLIMAKKGNKYIAGAFAMQDDTTLYGRHWGCITEIPFLHFELCYYQTIEHVIKTKLEKLDAGVQGEHKLARGFQPVGMTSAHWIREPNFSNVIADYLQRETKMMREQISILESHLPYRAVN